MNTLNKSLLIFSSILVITLWFLAQLGNVLTPFMVALIISYFLAPLVAFLERAKISRTFGAIISVGLFCIVVLIIFFTITPVLYKQLSVLTSRLYDHKNDINFIISKLLGKAQSISPEIAVKIEEALADFPIEIMNFFKAILTRLIGSGLIAVNIISTLVITYTLRDWKKGLVAIRALLPIRLQNPSQLLISDINHTLAGYVRGQAMVCTLMGCYYAIALTIAEIESGFALGIISGILTFIPYAGCFLSALLCIMTSVIQFNSFGHALLILAIFLIGQFIEGNLLVPKLIGKNINLHPVWIIFGLMAGGALMGFSGVLMALPLTAILGVIIRFVLAYYQRSNFYKTVK